MRCLAGPKDTTVPHISQIPLTLHKLYHPGTCLASGLTDSFTAELKHG
jgi:hypothetical protein